MTKQKQSCVLLLVVFLFPLFLLKAQTVDELQQNISTKNEEIKRLEQEIKAIDAKAKDAHQEASTLSSALKSIDASRAALMIRLNTAKAQIGATQKTIASLTNSIAAKDKELTQKRGVVGETIRLLAETTNDSQFNIMLGYDSLGEYYAQAQAVEQIQKNLTSAINSAKETRADLDANKSQKTKEAITLGNYQAQITDQKKVADAVSQEKKYLLDSTKSKEEEYQKILKQKQEEKEAVEKELYDFEAQLKFTLDPSSIPTAGTKVLGWPTDGGVVTQNFGNTAFSAARTTLYNGKGHNGIDIGVHSGTPVYAAADGMVRGSGNTDIACKGASYGNWMLIDYKGTNLSSLYGHLSIISVKKGTAVKSGQLVGYSGNTGYSTGPHLHFSVFVTKGVQISTLQSKVKSCGAYTMPVASFNSYLNPLLYVRVNN